MFSLTAAEGISIVTLSLDLTGINRALLRRGLVRYRNALVVIVASVLAIVLALALLAPAAAPDLAQPSHADRVLQLTDSWAKGDVIAVVRHGERCDRSSAQCLGPADGVTVRGEATVQALGADFNQLGLKNADIYSSLLTRARQTADAMFVHPVEAQDWLFNCRGTMLRDALNGALPKPTYNIAYADGTSNYTDRLQPTSLTDLLGRVPGVQVSRVRHGRGLAGRRGSGGVRRVRCFFRSARCAICRRR